MRKTISKYSKHIAGHVAGIIMIDNLKNQLDIEYEADK